MSLFILKDMTLITVPIIFILQSNETVWSVPILILIQFAFTKQTKL